MTKLREHLERQVAEGAVYCGHMPEAREVLAMLDAIEAQPLRERHIIDATWGEALMDGSVPSTKLQDKILAAVADNEQEASGGSR